MAVSQNGWPVVAKSACDQGPFAGVWFPNGILKGDVATIARWQLARYEATVEQLVPGTCWGWFVKPIEGSSTISNHSSATAWDINAQRHPMGVAASRNMSAAQISACHAIEAASHGTLRWGGDFSRPDPMHWEIIGSHTQVAAFATMLRNPQEEDDMSVADVRTGIFEVVDETANRSTPPGRQASEDLIVIMKGTVGPLVTPVLTALEGIAATLAEISAKLDEPGS